jgi:hypothetical protein
MDLDLFEGWTSSIPKQSKKAIVMMGRMNPPTAAHLHVIGKMWSYSQKHKLTPIVVLVHGEKTSKDKTKNPLDAEDRVSYLRSATPSANGMKIFISKSGGPGAFELVRENGYEPMVVAAGSDRAPGYLKILDEMFLDTDGSPIEHKIMPGLEDRQDPEEDGTPSEEVLELAEKGEDIPMFLISGSMARLAVKLGKRVAFSKVLGVKQSLSDPIFNKIAEALGIQKKDKDE